jgi:hypothetical protein
MLTFINNHTQLIVIIASMFAPLFILLTSGDHGLNGFPLDDAWIHFVYGRSISEGGYLAYNSGTPSTGATSPLWAYIIGLIHFIFSKAENIVIITKCVGITLHIIMGWAALRIVSYVSSSNMLGLAAGILLGISPPLAFASLSGMEITLGCAVCFLGFYSYLKKQFFVSGIFWGLSGITRPEYATVIIVMYTHALFTHIQGKMQLRKYIFFLLPVLVLGGLYIGWNLFVDLRPFPATFYVKAMIRTGMDIFTRLVIGFEILSTTPPFTYGIFWFGLIGLFWLRGRELVFSILCLFSGFSYLLGNLMLIPPWDPPAFYHIRYLLPVIPLFTLAISVCLFSGFKTAIEGAYQHREKGYYYFQYLSPTVIGLIILVVTVHSVTGWKPWQVKYSRDCRNINEVQVRLGKTVAHIFGHNSKIGTIDAGAIRYFGDRYTLDLLELNTKNVFKPNCKGTVLDGLVLMPAWINIPPGNKLVAIDNAKTEDYQVTSNRLMDNQTIAVCQSELLSVCNEFSFQILGKHVKVCLRCLKPIEMGALQVKASRQGIKEIRNR